MKDVWKAASVCIAVVIVAAAAVVLGTQEGDDGASLQYRMYIGLNDKDAGTQLVPTEDAMEIVDEICLVHVDGYTMVESKGVWTDDDGNRVRENSLLCIFDGTDIDTVRAIADEVMTALNQSSVLIESSEVISEYRY